jgi:hypothetical protein
VSGSYSGVARDCEKDPDEPGGKFCGDDADAVGILEASDTTFSFYVQAEANGAIDTATCGTDANTQNCFKATGGRSGDTLSGTARTRFEDLQPFEATISGADIDGEFFLDDPSDEFAQFVEFELTKDN